MKFICIGRNYAKHIQELQHETPKEPVFFLKPDSAITRCNRPFFLPDFSERVDYETEIIVKINRLGKCIAEKFAHLYYEEIGLGVDFTARDVQKRCIEHGDPWEVAKAFDGSAVVGKFVPKSTLPDVQNLNFHLLLNGEKVQEGYWRMAMLRKLTIISKKLDVLVEENDHKVVGLLAEPKGAHKSSNKTKKASEIKDFDEDDEKLEEDSDDVDESDNE